jgi:hypothetical protein
MRHPPATLLNPLKFPGALVPGLRCEFAGIAQQPVPEYLAALARRLDADAEGDEGLGQERDHGGQERDHGASATETSNRVDRGGRR